MRLLIPLTASLLLACGPPTPASTTTDVSTTDASTAVPDPSTTLTTTDTTTTPTTSSGTNLTVDFILHPDCGGTCPFQCDTWAQDCPPGQKCTFWAEGGGGAWNATKCVDITGDGAPGEPCTATGGGASGIDDCTLGAMCWDVDQTNHGTCIALCTGSEVNPMCPQHSVCVISGNGISICIGTCDPLLQDCSDDDLCIPNPDGTGFTCSIDASGDLGKTNDPCEFANACDKGLICLDTATASIACDPKSIGCCQPFCKFPNSPCPNPDQECIQFFDPMDIPPGYESVGVCAIPT